MKGSGYSVRYASRLSDGSHGDEASGHGPLCAGCLSSGREHGEGAMQVRVRMALSVQQEGWWACWQGSQLLGLPMGYAFWACFVELLETGHAP